MQPPHSPIAAPGAHLLSAGSCPHALQEKVETARAVHYLPVASFPGQIDVIGDVSTVAEPQEEVLGRGGIVRPVP